MEASAGSCEREVAAASEGSGFHRGVSEMGGILRLHGNLAHPWKTPESGLNRGLG